MALPGSQGAAELYTISTQTSDRGFRGKLVQNSCMFLLGLKQPGDSALHFRTNKKPNSGLALFIKSFLAYDGVLRNKSVGQSVFWFFSRIWLNFEMLPIEESKSMLVLKCGGRLRMQCNRSP
ncbi:hypothetical protein CEXT_391011 [Caerostris extrusa]|uniref:Uncharacterized protein n=1 Tax=Caerostris extrusa TaxID=172846 RepID=A0AAV4Q9X1_CAEEX|nr:hypothetical protein CEXT_391011 [Caerostris extrusa]